MKAIKYSNGYMDLAGSLMDVVCNLLLPASLFCKPNGWFLTEILTAGFSNKLTLISNHLEDKVFDGVVGLVLEVNLAVEP